MASAGHVHVPYPAVIPFVLVLLGIAVLPLIAHHWWESNRNKAVFAALIGIPTALYLFTLDWHMLLHAAEEFFSFIALLGFLSLDTNRRPARVGRTVGERYRCRAPSRCRHQGRRPRVEA